MIGIDTNVFLRFLVQDDNVSQHEIARRFMAERPEADPARVCTVVLAETIWVLRKRLGYSQDQICAAMQQLLCARDLVFEAHDYLEKILTDERKPETDIADYLVAWSNMQAGCRTTVTFDVDAARFAPGISLLK
jgi:predicted nucleic-acid-binding protein